MKIYMLLLTSGVALLLCSSCITAAVTAATSGAAGAASSGLGVAALSRMMNNGAPAALSDSTLTLKGDYNGTLRGSEGSYTRQSETVAVLTMGSETFYLTFTSGSEGSYAYENTAADGSCLTGHGTFTLNK